MLNQTMTKIRSQTPDDASGDASDVHDKNDEDTIETCVRNDLIKLINLSVKS